MRRRALRSGIIQTDELLWFSIDQYPDMGRVLLLPPAVAPVISRCSCHHILSHPFHPLHPFPPLMHPQVDSIDLPSIGPLFERNPVFPARTNTEFVQVLSSTHCRMTVWERGAGRTLACGTGACAVVVAGVLEGRLARSARVDLPGGPLDIEWSEEDGHVYMTGPAEMVFSGSLPDVAM